MFTQQSVDATVAHLMPLTQSAADAAIAAAISTAYSAISLGDTAAVTSVSVNGKSVTFSAGLTPLERISFWTSVKTAHAAARAGTENVRGLRSTSIRFQVSH